MTKVFFSVGMSLDGFLAPEGMELEHSFIRKRGGLEGRSPLQENPSAHLFIRKRGGLEGRSPLQENSSPHLFIRNRPER